LVDNLYRREKARRTAEEIEAWTNEMAVMAEAANVRVLQNIKPASKVKVMRELQRELAAHVSAFISTRFDAHLDDQTCCFRPEFLTTFTAFTSLV
jgi:hypothetical protein